MRREDWGWGEGEWASNIQKASAKTKEALIFLFFFFNLWWVVQELMGLKFRKEYIGQMLRAVSLW